MSDRILSLLDSVESIDERDVLAIWPDARAAIDLLVMSNRVERHGSTLRRVRPS